MQITSVLVVAVKHRRGGGWHTHFIWKLHYIAIHCSATTHPFHCLSLYMCYTLKYITMAITPSKQNVLKVRRWDCLQTFCFQAASLILSIWNSHLRYWQLVMVQETRDFFPSLLRNSFAEFVRLSPPYFYGFFSFYFPPRYIAFTFYDGFPYSH